MVITRATGIGLALAFVLAGAGAAYAGWKLSTQLLLNGWVQEQSGDVRGHIEALRLLRAGRAAEAIELLESRLDDDIIVLAPEGEDLRPPVEEEMRAALRAARQ
ncbi:MAG: hypothetical protein R3357_06875 [Burkholderiales bacterium]|nr:hypothetical protein [Burkholderiales bacterium]